MWRLPMESSWQEVWSRLNVSLGLESGIPRMFWIARLSIKIMIKFKNSTRKKRSKAFERIFSGNSDFPNLFPSDIFSFETDFLKATGSLSENAPTLRDFFRFQLLIIHICKRSFGIFSYVKVCHRTGWSCCSSATKNPILAFAELYNLWFRTSRVP